MYRMRTALRAGPRTTSGSQWLISAWQRRPPPPHIAACPPMCTNTPTHRTLGARASGLARHCWNDPTPTNPPDQRDAWLHLPPCPAARCDPVVHFPSRSLAHQELPSPGVLAAPAAAITTSSTGLMERSASARPCTAGQSCACIWSHADVVSDHRQRHRHCSGASRGRGTPCGCMRMLSSHLLRTFSAAPSHPCSAAWRARARGG